MVIGPARGVVRLAAGLSDYAALRALCAEALNPPKEVSMKANWVVIALALLIVIACVAGGDNKRCYDCASPVSSQLARSVRAVILRPFHEAASALDATADW